MKNNVNSDAVEAGAGPSKAVEQVSRHGCGLRLRLRVREIVGMGGTREEDRAARSLFSCGSEGAGAQVG